MSPAPDRLITIEPNPYRVRVVFNSRVVVDTTRALTLRETGYSPVHYVPRNDTVMALLARTDHKTHCPYKGDAAYYTIHADGQAATNAVWTYEAPHAGVAAIKDHLAFYPTRVDRIEEIAANADAQGPRPTAQH